MKYDLKHRGMDFVEFKTSSHSNLSACFVSGTEQDAGGIFY